MYETLTIKNHLGTLIGVVESFDGSIRVKYTNSDMLKFALEDFISRGINIPRIIDQSVVRIIANPQDADFLEKLAQYFQLSFDYLPLIKRSPEIQIETNIIREQHWKVVYKENVHFNMMDTLHNQFNNNVTTYMTSIDNSNLNIFHDNQVHELIVAVVNYDFTTSLNSIDLFKPHTSRNDQVHELRVSIGWD